MKCNTLIAQITLGMLILATPLMNHAFSIRQLMDRGEVHVAYSFREGISYLNLQSKQVTSLEGLTEIPGIQNCQRIDLSNNQLTRIERDAFLGISNLQELDLSNNHIEQVEPGAFAGLYEIDVLNLGRNQLTQSVIERVRLMLPGCMIATEGQTLPLAAPTA